MSFDIYIGELRLTEKDERDDEGYVRINVARTTHPDAPTFPNDDMTGNGNSRHPAYSGWSGFLRAAALPVGFYVEEHPGARRITQKDLDLINTALKRWQALHPDTVPGFDGFGGTRTGHDDVLARLLWLRFWTAWALTDCENPGVVNR